MADGQPDPVTAHLMNLVEGRQQSELMKVSALVDVVSKLDDVKGLLQSIDGRLGELVERKRRESERGP